MQDLIMERIRQLPTADDKFNTMREYLQCLVLKFIENSGYIKNIAFVGGTALRILYDLNRFSEDLDFSLTEKRGFEFEKFMERLKRAFEAWNLTVELKTKTVGAVKNALLKFPHLMHKAGLTHRKDQKLFIKVEIDLNPPAGSRTELSFNQKYIPLNIFHHDISSLFAGKLGAVLFRQYTKGRDFYDLMWFLGRKVEPNYTQLENSILQSTGEKSQIGKGTLKEKLLKRLSEVDFKKVQEELLRFVADKNEVKYVTSETLIKLLLDF